MQSDDLTRLPHDISEIDEVDPDEKIKTPEDKDDDFIEGGERDTNPDKLHKEAFGDEEELPIDEEVNKDEIARVKGLRERQQKKTS